MNAGEKRKAEEAVLQPTRPLKIVVVVTTGLGAKMDPRLLESSTEELNAELARLETQRIELKSALREIKFKMGDIRRLVGARNAAQHMEDFHLQTTIQELRHEEETISAEQRAFPAAGLRLPYEVILEIFSFLRAADLLKASTVSRAWHTITNDNLLWKHIVTKKWEKYSKKILNDRTSIHEDSSNRDWKKYFRWCESQNLRWASHLDYLTDVAESKRQATLGRKFLARGNNNAALKVLQAANRLVPSEEIESLIKSIQSGDPSVGQRLPEWQCQHCTYINSTSEGSCDMCTLPRFS